MYNNTKETISQQDHYDNLIRTQARYELLVDAILEAATELDYYGEDLYIHSEKLIPVLKVLEYEPYTYKVKTLQEAKKAKQIEKPAEAEPMD